MAELSPSGQTVAGAPSLPSGGGGGLGGFADLLLKLQASGQLGSDPGAAAGPAGGDLGMGALPGTGLPSGQPAPAGADIRDDPQKMQMLVQLLLSGMV